jgi:YesN/AraC family two-component response regulator
MNEKLSLMIVDDNPHARKALAALISTQDWATDIIEASNGKDALQKIESQTPDMVLMDVHMPVMDGLQATGIIKSRWPQIKVIVLTIYADYRSEAHQVGADAFLIKGCPTEKMMSSIQGLLQRE